MINTGYRRYTARVNSEVQRGAFTFGENATFVYSEKDLMDTGQGTPLVLSVQQLPTVPVHDESVTGGFGVGGPQNQTLIFNPVATQNLNDDENYYSRAPGHNAVIRDAAGTDWIVYHAIDRDQPTRPTGLPGVRWDQRVMLMDRLTYENGWPRVENGRPSSVAEVPAVAEE